MKKKFDQDLFLNLWCDPLGYFAKMNSTLGSVVPLAMFLMTRSVFGDDDYFNGKVFFFFSLGANKEYRLCITEAQLFRNGQWLLMITYQTFSDIFEEQKKEE